MRTFRIDVEHCQSCGGRMKLRALVMTTIGIERYLRWLGEPVDPPTLAPARDPPYFKSGGFAGGSASPPKRNCSTRTELTVDEARVHPKGGPCLPPSTKAATPIVSQASHSTPAVVRRVQTSWLARFEPKQRLS